MPVVTTFRSTVSPAQPRKPWNNFKFLVDPVSGAPVGIDNPNATGADGMWAPVEVTSAQISSPPAAMLADINSVFRLNVAPYTRFVSTGSALVTGLDGSAFLPLATGGTVAGPVTFNGGLTINNDPTTPVYINSTVTDPLAETIPTQFQTILNINSNNAQDILNFTARMHIKTNGGGTVFSSQHTPAVYGETSAIDTVAGGTVVWAAGVQGVSGNNGVGTVTNACDFLGHPVVNASTGTVTNHYIIYGPSGVPGKAVNEYGFYMPAPSGIGTATPVGWLEVRTPDSLSTTRVTRFRNSGGSILDIMGDSKIGWFGVAPVVRQTVSGAWAGNTAGKALCVALAAYGFIIDSTTA